MDDPRQEPPTDEFTELGQFRLDPATVRLLPRPFCAERGVVALTRGEGPHDPVTVGMVDPDDRLLGRRVADLLERPLRAVHLNRFEIDRALDLGWGRPTSDRERHLLRRRPLDRDAAVPELVDHLLLTALDRGASDLHIECYREDVDLRLRIDGMLHQSFTDISPVNVRQVVRRIKVLAGLDVTEHRVPQDGRLSVSIDAGEAMPGPEVDLRVSIIPGPAGEDVVIRVLDAEVGVLTLADLGLDAGTATTLERLLSNPEGLILVTGPTGSGKTTTLYAALGRLNDGRRKIVTAEDPIEYLVPKVNQKQVTTHVGMHAMLRALLRHDPDVMLIGEIRDLETGSTALAAAATGHLVLGTLHTPDAVGAVSRLRGLGLDDLDIADALLAVLAQRLVRRVCPACRQPDPPTPEQVALFGPLLDGVEPTAGAGCPACRHTGYRGRTGLFELLLLDPAQQTRIAERAPARVLRDAAAASGHVGLVADGLAKVRAGLTSLDELVRVLPYRQLVTARDEAAAAP